MSVDTFASYSRCYEAVASLQNISLVPLWMQDFIKLIIRPRSVNDVKAWQQRTLEIWRENNLPENTIPIIFDKLNCKQLVQNPNDILIPSWLEEFINPILNPKCVKVVESCQQKINTIPTIFDTLSCWKFIKKTNIPLIPPWMEDFINLITRPRKDGDVEGWQQRTLEILQENNCTASELEFFEKWNFLPENAIETICGKLNCYLLVEQTNILLPVTVEYKDEHISFYVCPYLPRHNAFVGYVSKIIFVSDMNMVDLIIKILYMLPYIRVREGFNFNEYCFVVNYGHSMLQLSSYGVGCKTFIEVVLDDDFEKDDPNEYFNCLAYSVYDLLMMCKDRKDKQLSTCEFAPVFDKPKPEINLNDFLENPLNKEFDYDNVNGGKFWLKFHKFYQNKATLV